MQGSATHRVAVTTRYPAEMPQLFELSLRGLEEMFQPAQELFCHRRVLTDRKLACEGLSPRYTLMTLLGLWRYTKLEREEVPFDLQGIFDRLLSSASWLENIGDLGLLLWTCAELRPARLPRLFVDLGCEQALDRYADARAAHTMELSWFLTGLSQASMACSGYSPIRRTAERVYRILRRNQGLYGFFGHSSMASSISGRLRGRFGSFADQVYPIVALTAAHRAFGWASSLDEAVACGEAILAVQGPLGQWWWHYDSVRGTVFDRYPVYSVHQDAMAPMALYALQEEAEMDTKQAILRGLEWIAGSNELGVDMRRPTEALVWRSLYHTDRYSNFARRLPLLIDVHMEEPTDDLTICREDRPYHFGWLLYAFSGRF